MQSKNVRLKVLSSVNHHPVSMTYCHFRSLSIPLWIHSLSCTMHIDFFMLQPTNKCINQNNYYWTYVSHSCQIIMNFGFQQCALHWFDFFVCECNGKIAIFCFCSILLILIRQYIKWVVETKCKWESESISNFYYYYYLMLRPRDCVLYSMHSILTHFDVFAYGNSVFTYAYK